MSGGTVTEVISSKLTKEEFGKRCREIIHCYREKNYGFIHNLYNNLVDVMQQDSKIGIKQKFYYLVKIYHPDMLQIHLNHFLRAKEENDQDVLNFLYTLMHTERTEKKSKKEDSSSGAAFGGDIFTGAAPREEYGYDFESEFGMDFDASFSEIEVEPEFMRVLNEIYFGNLDIHLDPIDLNQLDGELVLSDYDLIDIDGIEHCVNLTTLNLSGNKLSNIYNLRYLDRLIELDLSNNEIQDIEPLSCMDELEMLYLENNEIDDIDTLLQLPCLKFVVISGNPLSSMDAIYKLQSNGVTVIYY